MNATTRDLDALRDEALRLLRNYKSAGVDQRTPLLRQLAEVIVDAREHFSTDEGEPDWTGATYAYRSWYNDLYVDAHIDREHRPTVQAAVRYHVGNVLRDRLDEDTLRDLGIMKETPKERSAERRTNRMALLNALTKREMPGGDVLALSAVYTMLSNVTGDDFPALPAADREVLRSSLAEMRRRIETLQRRLDAE